MLLSAVQALQLRPVGQVQKLLHPSRKRWLVATQAIVSASATISDEHEF
jgi:hypothetical protein